MMKPSKNKADKSFHLQNESGDVVAVFGYNGDYIIERKHRNKRTFHDTCFFPDNVYSTTFILEYADKVNKFGQEHKITRK